MAERLNNAIAAFFARHCSYPDKKDKCTARLNFLRGITVTLPAKIFTEVLQHMSGVEAVPRLQCRKSTGKK